MSLNEKKSVIAEMLKDLYDRLGTEIADVLVARECRHIASDSDFRKQIHNEHNLALLQIGREGARVKI